MRRATFQIPAIIVAGNLIMNGVDLFKQSHPIYAAVRRERMVTTSMLRFVLDTPVLNAHAVLRALLKPGDRITDTSSMKPRMVTQLVLKHVAYKQQSVTLEIPSPARTARQSDANVESPLPEPDRFQGKERKYSVHYILCKLLKPSGRKSYTMYFYTECRKGFHATHFSS